MTPIRKPFDAVLKRIAYESARPDPLVEATLGKIGRKIIQDAYASKATRVDLGNQADAYGYCVYFNREPVLQGYLEGTKYREDHFNAKKNRTVLGAIPDRKRHKQGRVEALHAIQNFVPQSSGWVLYIVNAMWYSLIHESRGLPIISQELLNAEEELRRVCGVDVKMEFLKYPYVK